MLKRNLILVLISVINLGYAQEVDYEKVAQIGKIICSCLDNNAEKPNLERINDCSSALAEGLSVIKSESLRHTYLRKSDTYLQKNCISYIEILSSKKSVVTDIRLENSNTMDILIKDEKGIGFSEINDKELLYHDFVGDTIYLTIKGDTLNESNKINNTSASFLIKPDALQPKMIFLDSKGAFYKDYYAKNEPIDFILVTETNGYRLFTKFTNSIVMSKKLWSVNGEKRTSN